ncbi:MAG: hypothetical protein VB138_07205 [Burkholderia sp.]
MGRRKCSDDERFQGRIRTVALMNELGSRAGTQNPEQFARWFDTQMARRYPRGWDTAGSSKWRKNFNGHTALTADYLTHLGVLFPDAEQLYRSGPERLWSALWEESGDFGENGCGLWSIYPQLGGSHSSDCWGQHHGYDGVLVDFEMHMLNDSRGVPLSKTTPLELLGRSIVLYRLYCRLSQVAQMDGVGAYLCVHLALRKAEQDLRELGIFDLLENYFISQEAIRLKQDSRSERLACDAFWLKHWSFDPEAYAADPYQFIRFDDRFITLGQRWRYCLAGQCGEGMIGRREKLIENVEGDRLMRAQLDVEREEWRARQVAAMLPTKDRRASSPNPQLEDAYIA